MQKSSKILLCVSLEVEPGPCPKSALLFIDCFSLVSAFPPFPDIQLFESAFWNSGNVMEAEGYSLQTRNGGHSKASIPRSPTGSCSVSMSKPENKAFPVARNSFRIISLKNRIQLSKF